MKHRSKRFGEIRIDSNGNIYTKENNNRKIEELLKHKRKLLKLFNNEQLDEYLIHNGLDRDDIIDVKNEIIHYEEKKKQSKIKIKIFGKTKY